MSDLVTSVREGLDVFFAPGPELIEVRILKTPKKTVSGYFDSLDLAAAAVDTPPRAMWPTPPSTRR